MSLKQAIGEVILAEECYELCPDTERNSYLFHVLMFIPTLPLYLLLDFDNLKETSIGKILLVSLITAIFWTVILYIALKGIFTI